MPQHTTFAVEGCCHGDLDRIYEVIERIETRENLSVDFMICCGDFQAIRTPEELETLACPPVYREMKDFHKYWRDESVPRCLTLFVGGNHEAPGHLRDMYFGGYASNGIFYMGASGVFKVNGLRIAGLSGIYKSHDYEKPIFESPPYNESTKRSAYHVRRFEVEKLMQVKGPVDIVVSHDWPSGITDFGDTETLLRLKDRTGQLRSEINSKQLGNPHTMKLLRKLKPKFWFAGHMHVKYPAIYRHEDGVSITRFLALDKCIPRRPFLQLLSVDEEGKMVITASPPRLRNGINQVGLDPEWLAILKANNDAMPVPSTGFNGAQVRAVSESEIQSMKNFLGSKGVFQVEYLGQTCPGDPRYRKWMCDLLGMSDKLDMGSTSQKEASLSASDPSTLLFFED